MRDVVKGKGAAGAVGVAAPTQIWQRKVEALKPSVPQKPESEWPAESCAAGPHHRKMHTCCLQEGELQALDALLYQMEVAAEASRAKLAMLGPTLRVFSIWLLRLADALQVPDGSAQRSAAQHASSLQARTHARFHLMHSHAVQHPSMVAFEVAGPPDLVRAAARLSRQLPNLSALL